MIAIISLLLVIYLLLLITKIASIILIHTGLPENIARFQARSAVTGCGFTTSESEDIVNNLVRRKVISNLMLVGNVGLIASTSSFLISMFQLKTEQYAYEIFYRAAILLGGLAVFWMFSKSRIFERMVIRMFESVNRLPMRWNRGHMNALTNLDVHFLVAEVYLFHGAELIGKRVDFIPSAAPDLILLGINRNSSGAHYIGTPEPGMIFKENDTIVLYGKKDTIAEFAGQYSISLRG